MMTDETRERLQAAVAAFAKVFGELVETVRRAMTLAMQCLHVFAVALSAAAVLAVCPQADRERLVRHLSACADPRQRAQYMVSQVRLGRRVPMLA